MLAVTILLALLLSLGALAWVVWPLLDRAPAPVLVADDRLAELIGRKDAVVSAIRDLEFDFKLGKLDAEDYKRYDERLRRQAVALLQQIEQVAPASTGLDAAVESEVLRRRRVPEAQSPAFAPRPVLVAAGAAAAGAAPATAAPATNGAPVAANGGPRRFCTTCGSLLQPEHRFCATCGTRVETPEVHASES